MDVIDLRKNAVTFQQSKGGGKLASLPTRVSRDASLPPPWMRLVVVYSPSCLSEPSPEADSWLVFFAAAILLKAVARAGARASARAGASASAMAGASAATSTALSNGDACETVRAM